MEDLDGRLWLADQFHELDELDEARVDYRFVLDRFDPRGTGCRLADSAVAPLEELKEALRRTRGLGRLDLPVARAELDRIRECLAGRPASPGREAQPPDFPAGIRMVAEFLRRYPSYDLDDGGRPGEARRALEALGAEMDFRAGMLHARRRLVDCCVRLARRAAGSGDAEGAARLCGEGLAEADRIADLLFRDAWFRADLAECLLGAGQAEKARAVYHRLRRALEPGGQLWWRATQGLYRAHLEVGDRDAAARLRARLTIDYPREAPARLKP